MVVCQTRRKFHGHFLAYDRDLGPDRVVLCFELQPGTQRDRRGQTPRTRGSYTSRDLVHGHRYGHSGRRPRHCPRHEAVSGPGVCHHDLGTRDRALVRNAVHGKAPRVALLPEHDVPAGLRCRNRRPGPETPGLRPHHELPVMEDEKKV